jgi:hypothetical protein
MELSIHQRITATFNRDVPLHRANAFNEAVGEVILTFAKGESIEGYYIDVQDGWYGLEIPINEKYERVKISKESVTVTAVTINIPENHRERLELQRFVVSQLLTQANGREQFAVWSRQLGSYPHVTVEGTFKTWYGSVIYLKQRQKQLHPVGGDVWICTMHTSYQWVEGYGYAPTAESEDFANLSTTVSRKFSDR